MWEVIFLNLVQLNNFVRIAEIGSFSKAENLLFISKNALKKQIDSLEIELGFSLFIRTSKGLQLTEAGELFFKKIKPLCQEVKSTVDECKNLLGMEKKSIKIGFYTITTMNEWYNEIEKKSNLVIQQVLSTRMTHEDNFKMLSEGLIDFLEYEDNDQLYRNHFCYTKIKEDQLCCVMSKKHELSNREYLHPKDLIGYDIYCWSANSSAIRHLDKYKMKYNLKLKKHPFSVEGILDICKKGSIYILSNDTASMFIPLKLVPIKPKIPYHRGLIYKPENEGILQEMLEVTAGKSLKNFVGNSYKL